MFRPNPGSKARILSKPLEKPHLEVLLADLSVQALVDAGAHIGCRVNRWNPKMEPFIFEARNRIHIIDLKQTIRGILRSRHFLREIVASGQDVLFVGTKNQIASEIVRLHEQTKMPYVDDRWIGGTLTNYEVIGSRINYLEELEQKEKDGYLDSLPSKAASRFMREKRKVYRNLHGIRDMFKLPGALVIVDPRTERNAVAEATRMGIPVVGIVDTDGDPDVCDIVIAANDDAIRSVALILEQLSESVQEGVRLRKERGITERQGQEEAKVSAPTPRPKGRRGARGLKPTRLPIMPVTPQGEKESSPEAPAATPGSEAAAPSEQPKPESDGGSATPPPAGS